MAAAARITTVSSRKGCGYCAPACRTDSIQFGPLEELRERAAGRLAQLHEPGVAGARLYGEDPGDGDGDGGAFFRLLDEPEVYGLPPDPAVTARDLPAIWRRAGAAAATLAAGFLAAFAGRRGEGGRVRGRLHSDTEREQSLMGHLSRLWASSLPR